MDSYDKELISIIDNLNSKWTALHDKYKKLQSSYSETIRKNEEVEIKLAQAHCQALKAEEENKRLNVVVRKLQKNVFTGSLHQLFSDLKKKIQIYDEAILPSVAELIKNVTDNDLNTYTRKEESNYSSRSNFGIRKPPTVHAIDESSSNANKTHVDDINATQPTQSALFKPIADQASNRVEQNLSKTVEKSNVQKKSVFYYGSKITSFPAITSSTSAQQRSKTSEGSVTSSSADSCISSTTSLTKIPTSNETETERPTCPSLSVAAKPSKNTDHKYFIDISQIEQFCTEEQVLESRAVSLIPELNTDSVREAPLNSGCKAPSNQEKKTILKNSENDNRRETKEQPKGTKRPLSPPLEDPPSSSKRTATRTLIYPSSSSTQLKCLICEYENMEEIGNTFPTPGALDDHIIANHPNSNPCYKRCMFNNGACKKHFSRKQKFNQHVKQAHPKENTDIYFQANQDRLWKCTICGELFLFGSDLNEHNKRAHPSHSSNKKVVLKINRPLSDKKRRSRTSNQSVNMTECEMCEKESRSSTTHRLHDQLDAHILKCQLNPFMDHLLCPYCRRHFKQVKLLTLHIADKHPNSYVSSPLKKFMPLENSEGGMGQEVTHDTTTNTEINSSDKSTSVEACSLKVLSPRAINNKCS